MVATPQEIESIEDFFKTASLPKEMWVNKAVRMMDVPAFVKQVLDNLKRADIAEACLRPRYEDLLLIKGILEKGGDNAVKH